MPSIFERFIANSKANSDQKSSNSASEESKKLRYTQDTRIDPSADRSFSTLDQHTVWELISKLRDLNNPYRYRYGEYDLMSDDTIIQSALELYSDDATQPDSRSGKIVYISSSDNRLARDLNTLMDVLQIEDRIWGWAYNLAKYGDLYLKVYTDDKGKKLKLEDVSDPSLIMDLYSMGDRVNFAEQIENDDPTRIPSRSNRYEFYLYGPDDFIHFMVRKTTKYDKFEIELNEERTEETGEPKIARYNIMRGTSMIEGVRMVYRVLQLLEDSLLAARIAKAEFLRVFNIEVGNDSTPAQTTEIVNSVKRMFDSKASFDMNTGRYVANKNFRPIADPIFNPVREGKGAVSHESIGGDFEVKNIIDIDYFNNKLFSGLKIPKVLLGFEDALPVGTDGDVLAQLDIRYSRTVKRLIKALQNGIVDICNLWLKLRGRTSSINDFKVVMRAPSSNEEMSRLSELESKINSVNNIVQSMTANFGDYVNIPKIYLALFQKLIDYPEITDSIIEDLKKAVELAEKDRMRDPQDKFDFGSGPDGEERKESKNNPPEEREPSATDYVEEHKPDVTPPTSTEGGVF